MSRTELPAGSASSVPPVVRTFGRFRLLRLIGRSDRTMAWRVEDTRSGDTLVLVMPRSSPGSPAALGQWVETARRASRIAHPHLAPVREVGSQEGWPFAAYDLGEAVSLREMLDPRGLPAQDLARLVEQALQGLAYAHDAGVYHQDIQPYMLYLTPQGAIRLAGLEVAGRVGKSDTGSGLRLDDLSAMRERALRDVNSMGLLLAQGLTGHPPLGEPDYGRVLMRLLPLGGECVHVEPDDSGQRPSALCAIANRAADPDELKTFANARALARALEGWLHARLGATGDLLELLPDRLNAAGTLPATRETASRAGGILAMERQSTAEMAEVVLEDVALCFELLRMVNTAEFRGHQIASSGPVLTIRRAISMIGMDGVRRAAQSLKRWPGSLDAQGAVALERLIERVKRAGRAALLLRPPAFTTEAIYIVTLLQNLGRLAVHYHFADQARQIRQMMQSVPPARAGDPTRPGATEESAALAVLGVDLDTVGTAVARHWGMDESVLAMMRRWPADAPVLAADGDDQVIRATASCANELLDIEELPAARQRDALQRIAKRYARAIGVTLVQLQEALDSPGGALDAAPTDVAPLYMSGSSRSDRRT